MVGADGVAYLGFLLVFLGQLHAQECVGQFGLFVGYLADIVQEAGAACLFGVKAEFRSHDGAEIGGFAGVLQKILAVAGAVFHFSDQAD